MISKELHVGHRNEQIFENPPMPDEYPFWLSEYGHTFADVNYHEITFNTKICRVEYVLSGKGIINSQNISTVVNAGDTYILHEGDDHNYYSDPKNPMDKIWFNCHGVLVKSLMSIYKINDVILFKDVDSSEWITNMQEICRSYDDPYMIQTKTSAYFLEFVQFLSKQHHETMLNADELDNVKTYMDLHIRDNITVADLAEMMHISQNHIIRIFKARYGITPHQYILQSKLSAARIMLRTSDMSIATIADELNFLSPTSFSDMFAKKYGIRPLPYRQKFNKKYT